VPPAFRRVFPAALSGQADSTDPACQAHGAGTRRRLLDPV